jgi:hypothetical protein
MRRADPLGSARLLFHLKREKARYGGPFSKGKRNNENLTSKDEKSKGGSNALKLWRKGEAGA